MHFELDENQQMLRQMVKELTRDALAADAGEWERAGAVPDAVLASLSELGLFGVCVAENLGGADMDLTALALATEELAVGEAGLATLIWTHNALCCAHLMRAASVEQLKRWMPALAAGRMLGTWAGGSVDSGVLTMGAERIGDGWRLTGSAPAVAAVERADLAVVVAATGPGEATAFVLERGEWQARPDEVIGLRTAGLGELVLDGVEIDDGRRIGGIGQAAVDEAAVVDRARICRAAVAVGLGRAAFDGGVAYAAERQQFGQRLADFQAIQWMIADGATELDAARLLYRRAAAVIDDGGRATAEAAMARVFAVEKAQAACDRALQIHGGYGYTRDYAVERHWRDAYAAAVGEGTNPALQRLVIARDLLAESA